MQLSQNLRRLKLIFIALLISFCAVASNVTFPRDVSQAAEVKQRIGLTDITINYSRPGVTDRSGNDRTGKIWGSLVPYGFNVDGFGNGKPIPWRAGANENTTFTCSSDITVEGKKLNEGNIDKAIELFRLNVKRNPKVANCYDSLGEALRAKGNNDEAIKNFRKSLSLNPAPNVKANSIKNLKEM